MKILKIFIIGLVVVSVFSCNKYESGPFVSFVSRTNRITQSWDYSAVYRNGLDITSGIDTSGIDYSQSQIGFAEDNRFSYYDVINGEEFIGDGFWEFIDDDNNLKLIYEDSAKTTKVYKITRLEQNFLWFEEDLDNNTTIEYQLIPRN